MAYKNYSDAFKTEAMVRLAINRFDYEKTAEQTGVTERSLRNWEKDFPKKGVPELLERAIERMLMVIPENWTGHDWAVSLGILIDKLQLIHGEPTERTENIFTAIQSLPDDELDDIIRQFEQAANGRSVVTGKNGKGTPSG